VKSFTHLARLLLLTVSGGMLAPVAWAADAPIVREIYTCSFNDGKDMDDLMSARDYYINQMGKADQDPSMAFVWTPYKASVGFDFLWANNSENMMAFAEGADAFNESPEGVAAMDRFNTVASCTSSLAMRRQTYQAEGELTPGSNGALINAFACNYRHGRGPDDLGDLVDHVSRVLGSLDLEDGSSGYISVPSVGAGPDSADFYFYGVHSSLTNWAARTATLQASQDAPSLIRHLQTIAECSGVLFHGQRVVPPLE